tara:strand:+ start:935 stop:1156 length:222 start_codon:yes stop_codon:yes gene_type:complete
MTMSWKYCMTLTVSLRSLPQGHEMAEMALRLLWRNYQRIRRWLNTLKHSLQMQQMLLFYSMLTLPSTVGSEKQ